MKLVFRNHTPIIISATAINGIKKLFGFSIRAITLFPFILVRDDEILNSKDIVNHESIHIRQYIETLIVILLVISVCQYLYALLILKKSRLQAYYYMSHEQEAHQNDQNISYLKERKWFSYYKYLLPKNKKRMDLIEGKRVIV